jgi:hypothetical protein
MEYSFSSMFDAKHLFCQPLRVLHIFWKAIPNKEQSNDSNYQWNRRLEQSTPNLNHKAAIRSYQESILGYLKEFE